jgi:hypothetical protein
MIGIGNSLVGDPRKAAQDVDLGWRLDLAQPSQEILRRREFDLGPLLSGN